MYIPPVLSTISSALLGEGARMVLVGGCVRDYFLKLPVKDYDIEVYGLDSLDRLEAILKRFGKVKAVGKSFGILKFLHEGAEYDFAFPRIERKTGKGHRGFSVEVDGGLDFATAARRRDFTINAMGYDVEGDLFLDPFGGRRDLQQQILRHVDSRTFIEDPLRLYRGMQFCARFALQMHRETEALCRRMVAAGMLDELPRERVFDEWKKLFLKAPTPSVGLALLKTTGAIASFPPLDMFAQAVWERSLRRVDMMAILRPDDAKRALVLMFAALCLSCSAESISAFVALFTDEKGLAEKIAVYVRHVPAVEAIYRQRRHDADTQLRKLACEVEIADLILLAKAAFWARHEEQIRFEAGEWVRKRAGELGILHAPPPPLLQGKDLIAHLHLKPSPRFKTILEKVYQLQLEGKIASREEALEKIAKGAL